MRCLTLAAQRVRAVTRRFWTGRAVQNDLRLRPVRIAPGALGPGVPDRSLWVSRQHGVLVSAPDVRRMTGRSTTCVPAIALTALPKIGFAPAPHGVAYIHILLAHHDFVFANGVPTESLNPANKAWQGMPGAAPETREDALEPMSRLAGKRARRLVTRLRRNGTAPLQGYTAQAD